MAKPNIITREKRELNRGATNPTKSVIRGRFPAQQSLDKKVTVLSRINAVLVVSLILAIILSMVSYLGVLAKESKIKELHSATNKVNYENIELQNKVDYLKSLYALDNKVQKIGFLKKADKVIQVKSHGAPPPIFSNTRKRLNMTSVSGF